MSWRDLLDTAVQKSKEKIVETVTVENAKKALSGIAVAAATAMVDKIKEEAGKQRERREHFENESDEVLSRLAKKTAGTADSSSRMAARVLSQRLRYLDSKSNDELRIVSVSYNHSEAEREHAAELLRRRS
ncbi:hypothetical protein [Pseudomonas japonica]|uniref:hypothetical protein n=1 Tax=Pseudomonas japonica TaxID=256466 RepID=UPI0005A7747E|nr:hypothetical protein [Pseudomonas japonica]